MSATIEDTDRWHVTYRRWGGMRTHGQPLPRTEAEHLAEKMSYEMSVEYVVVSRCKGGPIGRCWECLASTGGFGL